MFLGIPLFTLLLIVVGTVVAIGGPALVAELSWSGRPVLRRTARRSYRRPAQHWAVAAW